MTKENFASINVIIDASGSMGHLQTDTIGNFNSFLKEQQDFPGEAVFTLCTFNDESTLVHNFVKIASIPNLNTKSYRPGGNTALLDAVGSTIDDVGRKLAALPEEERPSKVLFVIITDGEENSSRRYTREQIKSMVEHQQQVYSWTFVFIGANIDAFTAGTSMGISASNSVSYVASAAGTASTYNSISSNTSAYRRSKSSLAPDFFGQTGITPTSPVPVVTTTTTTVTGAPVPPVVPSTPSTSNATK